MCFRKFFIFDLISWKITCREHFREGKISSTMVEESVRLKGSIAFILRDTFIYLTAFEGRKVKECTKSVESIA